MTEQEAIAAWQHHLLVQNRILLATVGLLVIFLALKIIALCKRHPKQRSEDDHD